MENANVYVQGRFAGVLSREAADRYTFRYDPDYARAHPDEPVCRRMPVREETYVSTSLFPFFSNLLSEGSNRAFQEKYHRLTPGDDFALLLKIAGYDTIGAVTVRPS